MLRYCPVGGRYLNGYCLLSGRILSVVTKPAHGGGVGGDDKPIRPSLYDGGLLRFGGGNDSLTSYEDDVSAEEPAMSACCFDEDSDCSFLGRTGRQGHYVIHR